MLRHRPGSAIYPVQKLLLPSGIRPASMQGTEAVSVVAGGRAQVTYREFCSWPPTSTNDTPPPPVALKVFIRWRNRMRCVWLWDEYVLQWQSHLKKVGSIWWMTIDDRKGYEKLLSQINLFFCWQLNILITLLQELKSERDIQAIVIHLGKWRCTQCKILIVYRYCTINVRLPSNSGFSSLRQSLFHSLCHALSSFAVINSVCISWAQCDPRAFDVIE